MNIMPRTLDEFYRQLLKNIPAESIDIVRKALHWLVLSARPMTLMELAEAVMINPSYPNFNMEERFDCEECLLDILPSALIRDIPHPNAGLQASEDYDDNISQSKQVVLSTKSTSPFIQLAHHSVKDFLLSVTPPASKFRIDERLARSLLEDVCMSYALYVMQAVSISTENNGLFRKFPLLDYVCGCAPYHLMHRHNRVLLYYLAVNFFWSSSVNPVLLTRILRSQALVQARELKTICSGSKSCEQCLQLISKPPRMSTIAELFPISVQSFTRLLIPGKFPKISHNDSRRLIGLDYVLGGLTKGRQSPIFKQEGVTWGLKEIRTQLAWGYSQPLEVNLVSFKFDNIDTSVKEKIDYETGTQLGILSTGVASISLAEELDNYVQRITREGLDEYCSAIYPEQTSNIHENLLRAVCIWYSHGLENHDEVSLLYLVEIEDY